jgi:hypothetical protein
MVADETYSRNGFNRSIPILGTEPYRCRNNKRMARTADNTKCYHLEQACADALKALGTTVGFAHFGSRELKGTQCLKGTNFIYEYAKTIANYLQIP